MNTTQSVFPIITPPASAPVGTAQLTDLDRAIFAKLNGGK